MASTSRLPVDQPNANILPFVPREPPAAGYVFQPSCDLERYTILDEDTVELVVARVPRYMAQAWLLMLKSAGIIVS